MKNKKIVLTIIGIMLVILVSISVSYALWVITSTQTKQNKITTGCLSISIDNESNDIELLEQFPITDAEGKKLTPYEFTITNNCSSTVDYHVNLESIGTQTGALKASSIKVMLNDNEPKKLFAYLETDTTLANAYEAYTLGYGTLASKGSATYELRLWVDEDAPNSEQEKTYTSKISVSVGQGIDATEPSAAAPILAHAAENNYLYTTTPDFSQVTADGEYGLYQAKDDYGTSYYFRGDVNNNYVKFGVVSGTEDDMYWRIVRINGDGTIRLVYDGSSGAYENGVVHSPAPSKMNFNANCYEEKCLGYTYDIDGTETDSTVKSYVEEWYEINLETGYGKYIADSIFCNDRSVSGTYTQEGALFTYVYYGALNRLINNKSPILSCPQEADKYTVNENKGNGLLSKPIGLLTADEVVMAGGSASLSNITYYLYSGAGHWTMTPHQYQPQPYMFVEGIDSLSLGSTVSVNGYDYGVRPVINLRADVTLTGTGEKDSPYQVVME